jgi:hypothetical protein
MPYYFYIYNISLNDFAVIQTIRAKIYLFTMGTLYKIGSRILVLASTGQGNLQKNLPVRRHSVQVSSVLIVATHLSRRIHTSTHLFHTTYQSIHQHSHLLAKIKQLTPIMPSLCSVLSASSLHYLTRRRQNRTHDISPATVPPIKPPALHLECIRNHVRIQCRPNFKQRKPAPKNVASLISTPAVLTEILQDALGLNRDLG